MRRMGVDLEHTQPVRLNATAFDTVRETEVLQSLDKVAKAIHLELGLIHHVRRGVKAAKLTTDIALTIPACAERVCGDERSIEADDSVLRLKLLYDGC
ncbi:MAG: hypothetical protein QOF63_1911 [Thermoanaerobaculia bacterium]|nr:hypothetical protein [Thermoanaerobaculia bacterium]